MLESACGELGLTPGSAVRTASVTENSGDTAEIFTFFRYAIGRIPYHERYPTLKAWLWLKKTLTQGCVFYSVLFTAVYLLGVFVDASWVPTLHMVLSLMAFSFVLAAANRFLYSRRLIFPLRLLIHFAVTTAVFYIVFVRWGGYQESGGSVLTALLLYVFAYILCAAVVWAYRWLTAELRSSESEYRNAFDGEDGYVSQFGSKK